MNMYRDGWDVSEMADALKAQPTTIKSWMRKVDDDDREERTKAQRRTKLQEPSDEDLQVDMNGIGELRLNDRDAYRNAVLDYYRQGATMRAIAKNAGVSAQAIWNLCDRYGTASDERIRREAQAAVAQRRRGQQKRQRSMGLKCLVCQKAITQPRTGRRTTSCSPKCAKLYTTLRRYLNPVAFQKHRIWVLGEVAKTTPPNRRYVVPGSATDQAIDQLPKKHWLRRWRDELRQNRPR